MPLVIPLQSCTKKSQHQWRSYLESHQKIYSASTWKKPLKTNSSCNTNSWKQWKLNIVHKSTQWCSDLKYHKDENRQVEKKVNLTPQYKRSLWWMMQNHWHSMQKNGSNQNYTEDEWVSLNYSLKKGTIRLSKGMIIKKPAFRKRSPLYTTYHYNVQNFVSKKKPVYTSILWEI